MKQSVYAALVSSAAAQINVPSVIRSTADLLDMAADKAIPKPYFRSDTVDQFCTNAAVQLKDTAVTKAKTDLGKLEAEVTTLEGKVATALATKKSAVDAVIAADTAAATAIDADDAADYALLLALRAMNAAAYDLAAKTTAAKTALDAKTAIDGKVVTQTALKTERDNAAIEANRHKLDEDALLTAALLAKNTADSAYTTPALNTSNAKTSWETAVRDTATAKTNSDADLVSYNAAEALRKAYADNRITEGKSKVGTSSGPMGYNAYDVNIAVAGVSSPTIDQKYKQNWGLTSGATISINIVSTTTTGCKTAFNQLTTTTVAELMCEANSYSNTYWTKVKASVDYWTKYKDSVGVSGTIEATRNACIGSTPKKVWEVMTAGTAAVGTIGNPGWVAAVATTYKCVEGDTLGTRAYEAWKFLAVDTENKWQLLIKMLQNELNVGAVWESAGFTPPSYKYWNPFGSSLTTTQTQAITAMYTATNSAADNKCDGTTTVYGSGNAGTLDAGQSKTDAVCAAACAALKPYDLTASSAALTNNNANTYCTGYQWEAANSGTCTGQYNGVPAGTATGAATGDRCYQRLAVTKANEYLTALLLSATTVATYTTMVQVGSTGNILQDYYNLVKEADDAYKPMYVQQAMNTKMATDYAYAGQTNPSVIAPGVLVARNKAANAYDKTILDMNSVVGGAAITRVTPADGTKNIYDTKLSDETSKKTTYDNMKAISDPKLTAKTAATSAWNLATTQQALQVKVKAAADAAKAKADTDLAAMKLQATAANTANTNAITAKNAATTANTAAVNDYNTKKATVTTANTAAATPLAGLVTKRATAATAWTALDTANANLAAKKLAVAQQKTALTVALAEQTKAVLECKEAKYDSYKRSLAAALAKRQTDLTAIETLIDDTIAKKPAALAKGARCEKPTSAGHSKARGKVCEGDALCCGAATGTVGGAKMTIEVCNDKTATTYDYQPPRAPLSTVFPAKQSWPFACIGGAKHLAAAATAVAGAFYMMA